MEILGFVVLSLMGGVGGLIVFLHYLKKGEFEDPEDAKYPMFWEDD